MFQKPPVTPPARGAFMVLVAVIVASCGDGDPDSTNVAASDVATTATAPATLPAEPTTTTPTTTPTTTTTTTTTTEPCGAFCPLTADRQAVIDRFFDAYNGDDWDAFRAVLVDEDVSWEFTPTLVQTEEQMRLDFGWSAGLNETWTPEECIDQFGIITCSVIIEDDVHRTLAPFGFQPSRCSITVEVENDVVRPLSYDAIISGCHEVYDGAMHRFGDWFAETYPDQPSIQGIHYRAWNQPDESAPARAAEHLPGWAEHVQQFVDDGGDIFAGTHHG